MALSAFIQLAAISLAVFQVANAQRTMAWGLRDFTATVEVAALDARQVSTLAMVYSAQRAATNIVSNDIQRQAATVSVVAIDNRTIYQWALGGSDCAVVTPTRGDPLTAVEVASAFATGRVAVAQADRMMYANQTDVYGGRVRVDRWWGQGLTYGGCAIAEAEWLTRAGSDPARLLRMTLAATCPSSSSAGGGGATQRYRVTVANVQFTSVASGSRLFGALGTCNVTGALGLAAGTAAIGAGIDEAANGNFAPAGEPMPSLPPDFTALVQTTALQSGGTTFSVVETFSSSTRAARTTMLQSQTGNDQRGYSVLVNGAFQLAYQIEGVVGDAVRMFPTGDGSISARAFFDNAKLKGTPSCAKSIFNDNIISSVGDLLLQSKTNGFPRYVGRTVTRGIDVMLWEASTDLFSATWHFAATPGKNVGSQQQRWTFDANASIPLLRVVVRGTGRSPMFPHHPFFQRGEPVPKAMLDACASFFGGSDAHCNKGEANYVNVYDFFAFAPSVDPSDFVVPTECTTSQVDITAFPEASNCPPTLSSLALLMYCVLAALLAGFGTGIIVYMNMRHQLDKAKELGAAKDAGDDDNDTEMRRQRA